MFRPILFKELARMTFMISWFHIIIREPNYLKFSNYSERLLMKIYIETFNKSIVYFWIYQLFHIHRHRRWRRQRICFPKHTEARSIGWRFWRCRCVRCGPRCPSQTAWHRNIHGQTTFWELQRGSRIAQQRQFDRRQSWGWPTADFLTAVHSPELSSPV